MSLSRIPTQLITFRTGSIALPAMRHMASKPVALRAPPWKALPQRSFASSRPAVQMDHTSHINALRDARKDPKPIKADPAASTYSTSTINALRNAQIDPKPFKDFDLTGGIYVVTGGGGGLGLTMAEALAESGGTVYCLDIKESPPSSFDQVKERLYKQGFLGNMHYSRIDVRDVENVEFVMDTIATRHERIDGVLAAAGIQQVCPALEYTVTDVEKMLAVNYTGVFITATAAARQMFKYKIRGKIALVGSMSGMVANKGLITSVYNSSKAAVNQLARNLAMEWGRVREDGTGGIRVNSLSPGNILTPMVQKNFDDEPWLKELWEKENMLGRIAQPEEFKSAGLFLLSNASSFMTGGNLVIDGGYTAW